MITLLSHLWPSLSVALLLGVVVGWFSVSERPMAGLARAGTIMVALALLVLCIVALLGLVPGRPGLWLESGAFHGGVYLSGCFIGWVPARWLGASRKGSVQAGSTGPA
jgi:hypothetical protein